MLANESLGLRSHDDGLFLLPLTLHLSTFMRPVLSTTLHSGDSNLINAVSVAKALSSESNQKAGNMNADPRERRRMRYLGFIPSRTFCVQQRAQVFQALGPIPHIFFLANLALPTYDAPQPLLGNFTLQTSLMRNTKGHDGSETFPATTWEAAFGEPDKPI